MVAFREFVELYTALNEDEWQAIAAAFVRKEYAKNETILEEGGICRYFYFLEKGLIRFHTTSLSGNDITKFFTVAPYCFTSKNSFRLQVPAEESIQALEKVVVWQTSLKQANELLELRAWSTFTRKFLHEVQSHMEALLLELKTETAEQRYRQLLCRYPQLVEKIPLKHLASFLGIAPQSLSRIRKSIA